MTDLEHFALTRTTPPSFRERPESLEGAGAVLCWAVVGLVLIIVAAVAVFG